MHGIYIITRFDSTGDKVVTAPTNGAAGALKIVLRFEAFFLPARLEIPELLVRDHSGGHQISAPRR